MGKHSAAGRNSRQEEELLPVEQPEEEMEPQEGTGRRASGRGGRGKPEKKGVKVLFILLLVVLSAVFLFSGYKVVSILLDYRSARQEYDTLRDDYSPSDMEGLYAAIQDAEAAPTPAPTPEVTPLPDGSYEAPQGEGAGEEIPALADDSQEAVMVLTRDMAVDFDALLRTNSDTIGWLIIPGTTISYPVVHSHNNEDYITRTFTGKGNAVGTVFMDYEDAHDLSSRHILLYGHNMQDGSVFAPLVNYKKQDWFDQHRTILFITPEKVYRLQVFSAYYAQASSNQRTIEFADDSAFTTFVQKMLDRCKFSNGTASEIDQVFTLITCSYESSDARTFVHARVVGAYDYTIEE